MNRNNIISWITFEWDYHQTTFKIPVFHYLTILELYLLTQAPAKTWTAAPLRLRSNTFFLNYHIMLIKHRYLPLSSGSNHAAVVTRLITLSQPRPRAVTSPQSSITPCIVQWAPITLTLSLFTYRRTERRSTRRR